MTSDCISYFRTKKACWRRQETSVNIHILVLSFEIVTDGCLPHSPYQEIIVREEQQLSERVFLQLITKFRDDGLIVKWIDRLWLLLLQMRQALDNWLVCFLTINWSKSVTSQICTLAFTLFTYWHFKRDKILPKNVFIESKNTTR